MDYFIYGAGITELERLIHIVGRISSKKVKRVNKVDFDIVKLLALLCFNHLIQFSFILVDNKYVFARSLDYR